jgi:hypothetical protein
MQDMKLFSVNRIVHASVHVQACYHAVRTEATYRSTTPAIKRDRVKSLPKLAIYPFVSNSQTIIHTTRKKVELIYCV